MRYVTILTVAVLLGITSSAADAKRPIREVPEIYEPLFYIAVADDIRRKCPTISGKLFKGITALQQLRAQANRLGYTDAEIMAFYESKEERARMVERGASLLEKHGATRDDLDTYCAFGRAEIQRNSAIGVYLKAK